MDFFTATTPIDSYNTERFEVSSGPNSILFGFGNPGGLVNVMTTSAKIDRTRSDVRLQFGDWNLQRYELDHNQVVVPRRFAIRLNSLHEYGEVWRSNDFHGQRQRPVLIFRGTAEGRVRRRRRSVAKPLQTGTPWLFGNVPSQVD